MDKNTIEKICKNTKNTLYNAVCEHKTVTGYSTGLNKLDQKIELNQQILVDYMCFRSHANVKLGALSKDINGVLHNVIKLGIPNALPNW